jgi:hypothetical protein
LTLIGNNINGLEIHQIVYCGLNRALSCAVHQANY